MDFVENDLLKIKYNISKSAMYVLKNYGPCCLFTCDSHEEWGVKFATKIVINIFFNNKQDQSKEIVRKDTVTAFKKRQRTK